VADPAFAFNLAQLYESQGIIPMAYRFYAQYLELYPGADNAQGVRDTMTTLEADLNENHAQIVVHTTPEGAQVIIQQGEHDFPYGPSPAEGYVAPGSVIIKAELDGYETASAQRNAVAGVRIEVNLTLTAVISDDGGGGGVQPEEGMSTLGLVGWITMGVGIVLTGVGIYEWLDAASLESRHNDCAAGICENPPASLAELNQIGQDAQDAAMLGNVLGIPGVVLIVGGVTLVVVDSLLSSDSSTETAFAPLIWPGGMGVGFSGRF
jgi:hypothetical protein